MIDYSCKVPNSVYTQHLWLRKCMTKTGIPYCCFLLTILFSSRPDWQSRNDRAHIRSLVSPEACSSSHFSLNASNDMTDSVLNLIHRISIIPQVTASSPPSSPFPPRYLHYLLILGNQFLALHRGHLITQQSMGAKHLQQCLCACSLVAASMMLGVCRQTTVFRQH